MRAKNPKRILAEKLRKQDGLSYSEISLRVGVSKSTLSSWLREIRLSQKQEARLAQKMRVNRSNFAARAWPINRARHEQARKRAMLDGAKVATGLPSDPSIEELALAMLYLGEGAKSGGRVQLASTNFEILQYAIAALKKLYQIDESRLAFRLNLAKVAYSRERNIRRWWARRLGYPMSQFNTTQFDKRISSTRLTKEYRGVCTLTYADTYLQRRILSLAQTYILSRRP